jgi:hypothetical protein
VDNATEHVATQIVGPQRVAPAAIEWSRRLQALRQVDLQRIVWRDALGEEREKHENAQDED